MFFILMNGLLRPIVPAGIDPLFTIRVLPGTVDLGYDGFGNVVRILYMDPISDLPQFAVMQDTSR